MELMTIETVLREIQPAEQSMSLARREVATEQVRFNAEVVHIGQKVNVEDGSLLQVGSNTWQREGKLWVQLVPLRPQVEYRTLLHDASDPEIIRVRKSGVSRKVIGLHIRKSVADNMVMIGATGYGEHTAFDGGGFPIVLEFHEDQLRILVWGDINQEEPTDVISLEKAQENCRLNDEGNKKTNQVKTSKKTRQAKPIEGSGVRYVRLTSERVDELDALAERGRIKRMRNDEAERT